MEGGFQLQLEQIIKGNSQSFRQLIDSSSFIVRNWARKEKQELGWIAKNGYILDYNDLVAGVLKEYISELTTEKTIAYGMDHFRAYLIGEFEKTLLVYFSEFMELLKENRKNSWKIVINDLEKRSVAWFFKRDRSLREEYYTLFCESVELVYLKFTKGECVFNSSVAFKSFFFKTLEYKYLESLKNPYRKKAVSLDTMDFPVYLDEEIDIDRVERQKMLKTGMDHLTCEERYVLTEFFFAEKKLREIAIETGQSEENVRIRKFRALKKLQDHFKLFRYES
jgi:RNA polymerase sigma factor (sigma-70 family)